MDALTMKRDRVVLVLFVKWARVNVEPKRWLAAMQDTDVVGRQLVSEFLTYLAKGAENVESQGH